MTEKTYTPTIGLEVHAELKTETKMFCNSKNDPHSGEVNEHVCPVCMAHPGTLPTVNKKAVEAVISVGLAVEGTIATYTEFNRKNYFYPDIPKGYQISQHEYPLVSGGTLAGVALTRIHLEEDTARSVHDTGETSLLDFNRAGVPLMELVTEPVMHDARSAGDFARELQLLLRTLGVSDANMERGEMRVEANVSISDDPEVFGTKVEVKNINSFKAVEAAIIYEIQRQKEVLAAGEAVTQETRGWDENKSRTFSQRKKESSHDYRYFPEPDIPSIDLAHEGEISVSRLSEISPELPHNKRVRYQNLGLKESTANEMVLNIEFNRFYEEVLKELEKGETDSALVILSANYILSDIAGLLQSDVDIRLENASAPHFVMLMRMVHNKEITSRVAKDILTEVVFEHADPQQIAQERGLTQLDDVATLGTIVAEIIADNPDAVAQYKAGKESTIQFFVGQGMKKTQGSANPATLKQLFEEKLT